MENKTQIVFLILMCITIVIFSFTVFTLIKNIELLKKDPITFGIEKNGFDSCVCYGYMGTVFFGINESSYLSQSDKLRNKTTDYYPRLNFTLLKGE